THRVLTKVENRRGEHGARTTIADSRNQVFKRADATRSDHWHWHRISNRAGERDVKALPGAVAVHRGEQDLAGTERDDLAGIFDGVNAGGLTPAMGEYFPSIIPARPRYLLGVDRHHDTLIAELLRRLLDELTPLHRGGVDRYLVGAGPQQGPNVL